MNKDITIVKHFKINNEEYLIYRDGTKVSIGFLQNNQILKPTQEQLAILKKIIANLISSNPNNNLYYELNCTILDNTLTDNNITEVSTQHISLTENQMNNLLQTTVKSSPVIEEEKNNVALPIVIIIIILLIVGCVFAFKNHIKGGLSNFKGFSGKRMNDMNNVSSNADAEELLNTANRAMFIDNVDLFLSVFPKFMQDELRDEYNLQTLQKERLKSEYGSDVRITYTVTNKTKKEASWLNDLNDYFKRVYNTNIKATECYQLEGTATKSGSLKTDVNNDPYDEIWYCKFSDGTSKLVFG